MMISALARGYQVLGDERYLAAADYYLSPTWEIAVAGRRGGADTRRLLEVVRRKFIPNKILARYDPDEDSGPVEPMIPLLTDKGMIAGKAAAYVCRNSSCRAPVTDAVALEEVLEGRPPPRLKSCPRFARLLLASATLCAKLFLFRKML